MVTADDYAAAHGLVPLARIVSWASVGIEPERTGLAPTLAIPKALDRAGMAIGDIDLFEINEAFCTMAVASTRALGLDHDIVNVNGSGCGLGHPIAATGARMVVSMIHELRRRDADDGLRRHVCGRRHGLGPDPRAPVTLQERFSTAVSGVRTPETAVEIAMGN